MYSRERCTTPKLNEFGVFWIISPLLLLAPFCAFTAVSIMATKQKLKLLDQMKGFSLSKAKCFAESDRALVEDSIAKWFGYRGQGAPCGPNAKIECLGKFEECVREGEVFAKFMDKIGTQPGLLRFDDLGLCFFLVIQTLTFDMVSFYDEDNRMPHELWLEEVMFALGFLLPAALVFSFLVSSWVNEKVVRRFPNAPTRILMALTPLPIIVLYTLLPFVFLLSVYLTYQVRGGCHGGQV